MEGIVSFPKEIFSGAHYITGQVGLRANSFAAEKTNISAQNRNEIQFFLVVQT